MMIRNVPHKGIRMYDARQHINVSKLYPLTHRLERPRKDHLDLCNIPMTDEASTQLRRFQIMVPFPILEDHGRLYIHRLRGECSVDIGFVENDIAQYVAVLCISRENALGGLLQFKQPGALPISLECVPGSFVTFDTTKGPYMLTRIEPVVPGMESHLDLIWLLRK